MRKIILMAMPFLIYSASYAAINNLTNLAEEPLQQALAYASEIQNLRKVGNKKLSNQLEIYLKNEHVISTADKWTTLKPNDYPIKSNDTVLLSPDRNFFIEISEDKKLKVTTTRPHRDNGKLILGEPLGELDLKLIVKGKIKKIKNTKVNNILAIISKADKDFIVSLIDIDAIIMNLPQPFKPIVNRKMSGYMNF